MSAVIEIEIGSGEAPDVRSVRVLRSTGSGGGRGTLRLDVDALVARRPDLEMTVLASAVSARRVLSPGESELQQVGAELFDRLFEGEIGDAYRTSRAIALARGESLQLRLRLTDPDLAALPWEALYDRASGTYVCRKDSLIRQIAAPDSVVPLRVEPPLRILGLISGPRNLPPLDVEAERERLEKSLESQMAAGRVQLVWLENVSWERLHIALLSEPWHVLHFVGHSRYEAEGDEGVLAFCGPDGRADYVGAAALADLLHEAEPIPRLVVLNSCASGASGVTELFSGTAAALVGSGIDAAVAMQFTISDPAAIAFSRGFYTALAHGRTIDEAARSGRIAILGLGRDTLEWITPLLYVRGEDTRLFVVDSPVAGAAPAAIVPAVFDAPTPTAPAFEALAEPVEPALEPGQPTPAPVPTAVALAPTRGSAEADLAPADAAADSVPPAAEPGQRRRKAGWILLWAGLAALVIAGAASAFLLWIPGALDDASTADSSPSATTTAPSTPSTPPPPTIVTTEAAVLGSQVWTLTPVMCATGATLSIRAAGVVQPGGPETASGPDGMVGVFLATNVIDDANHAALIGRIGDAGVPFLVGPALDTTCPADGPLYLGVNDEGFEGNIGQFDATIQHEQ